MTKQIESKELEKVTAGLFYPLSEDSCSLLIGCNYDDYIPSRIARAVEDADARILNLNISSRDFPGFEVVVSIRFDHRNPEAVTHSLERYGYNIIDVDAPLSDQDTINERYLELMHYISM